MASQAAVAPSTLWSDLLREDRSDRHALTQAGGDFLREVYCFLGMPVDALDMAEALNRMEGAAKGNGPFLISTPNVNFLVNSLSDAEFRESLLLSDLCLADGMPIVLMARLLGIPIPERVAGSDIFEMLKAEHRAARPMTICLFGGLQGAAFEAAKALNSRPGGLVCVGAQDPGVGSVEELSSDELINGINASKANFLAVSLGAVKGQAWLKKNHHRLRIPIRAHVGAAVNFQSGVVKRAPLAWQKWGLEWLWRIKEEPHLWKRYAKDGTVLARLLITRVLPLAILARWQDFRSKRNSENLFVEMWQEDGPDNGNVILRLSGAGTERHIEKAIVAFFEAVVTRSDLVVVDLAGLRVVDARFLGLCLMLRKQLHAQGIRLAFRGASPFLSKLFRLHGVGFLLIDNQGAVDGILPPQQSALANAS